MSDFAELTGKFRANQTKTPNHSSSSKATKRPRTSLVCTQCRSSKLRCDRNAPCGSCVRRGEGAACSYRFRSAPGMEITSQTEVEDRLHHLESMVRQLRESQSSSSRSITPMGSSMDNSGTCEPRRGEKDVDSTNWSAILDDIDELKTALGESLDISAKESFDLRNPDNDEIFGAARFYSLETIINQYLPGKNEVDRLLAIYFQRESWIVPFVHVTQFQTRYRDFWADPTNFNPLWISTLFSICYMASLIGGATDSYRSSSNGKATGNPGLHTGAAQCLVLGEYHRPQPLTVEALVLFAQCKTVSSLDPSREAGAILGIAVRLAHEMGYHRDPDTLRGFTVFDGEMRRRCWAICKQMDMMLSFTLGLPSNIRMLSCDTKSPRNLLDSDFDIDCQTLPPSRSENEATGLLWFIVKDRLMPGFSKVCDHAFSIQEKAISEVLQLELEIRNLHFTVPKCLQPRPLSESILDSPVFIATRTYVDFLFQKSILILHRRHMVHGNELSTQRCIEAGTKVISHVLDMHKELAHGGQLQGERWIFNSFLWSDFHLAAMVLCQIVHVRRKRDFSDSIIDTALENILSLLRQSFLICIENSEASKDSQRVAKALQILLNTPLNTIMSTASVVSGSLDDLNLQSNGETNNGLVSESLFLQRGNVQSNAVDLGVFNLLDFIENFDSQDYAMSTSM
jgi:hypothetical protein